MQEEVNDRVIALSIKTGKLSAEVLQKSMKYFLIQMKQEANKCQMPHGKQTLKQLIGQTQAFPISKSQRITSKPLRKPQRNTELILP